MARAPVSCVGILAALTIVPMAMAQETGAHDHGIGRLGRVSFPVSCTPEAHRRFERAMAVLHSFWWAEGERAFGAVLEADPSCAMAHWGRALSLCTSPPRIPMLCNNPLHPHRCSWVGRR